MSSPCPPENLLHPDLFRALADPTRVALLLQLLKLQRACSVSEIAGCCPVDLSVVSRHLAVLRDAGILASRRHGKEVHYHVRCGALAATLHALADAIEACCPPTSPSQE